MKNYSPNHYNFKRVYKLEIIQLHIILFSKAPYLSIYPSASTFPPTMPRHIFLTKKKNYTITNSKQKEQVRIRMARISIRFSRFFIRQVRHSQHLRTYHSQKFQNPQSRTLLELDRSRSTTDRIRRLYTEQLCRPRNP